MVTKTVRSLEELEEASLLTSTELVDAMRSSVQFCKSINVSAVIKLIKRVQPKDLERQRILELAKIGSKVLKDIGNTEASQEYQNLVEQLERK